MGKTLRTTLFFISACCLTDYAIARTTRTEICIKNISQDTYYVTGKGLDSFDWEDLYDNGAMNRPDINWVNAELKPSEERCELADINYYASTIAFNFSITRSGFQSATLSRLITDGGSSSYWKVVSVGGGTLGSLSGTHFCMKDVDEEAEFCNLFYIKK
jgi:hypothetical protein